MGHAWVGRSIQARGARVYGGEVHILQSQIKARNGYELRQ
jgi:hypothetical protein